MYKKIIGLFVISLLLFSSCKQQSEKIITKRIQYDVNIKSPDPNYDWWIQNIAGPQREKLVSLILKGAKSGKVPAYDYYFQKISKKEVEKILSDTVMRKVRKTTPPYDLKDTLIVIKIHTSDIQRLRFMEEWRINPKNLSFEKKVMGIAPIARRYDQEGNVRWQPLFWILPDTDFLKEMENRDQP